MSPSQIQHATAASMMVSRTRFMPPLMRSTILETTRVAMPLAMMVLMPMYPMILKKKKRKCKRGSLYFYYRNEGQMRMLGSVNSPRRIHAT